MREGRGRGGGRKGKGGGRRDNRIEGGYEKRRRKQPSYLLPLLHTYRNSYHLQWWAVVRRLWSEDTKCGPGSTRGELWKVSGLRRKERGGGGGRGEEEGGGRRRGGGGGGGRRRKGGREVLVPTRFCVACFSPPSVENEAHCDFVKLREMLLR